MLVPEQMTAKPGQTLWVALDFALDEGWHTYWPGANDTGFPLDARVECSPQAAAGDLVWPAPQRYSDTEGILDHVFGGHMTVLLPLAVSPEARFGEEISLRIAMRWLVCKTACVAESAELSIRIPIADAVGKPSREVADLFERARSRVPRPVADDDPVRLDLTEQVLTITCKNAERLAFYPLEDCRRTRDLIRDGEAEGETLSIEFRQSNDPIRGVLEVWSNRTESKLYAIEWPPAEQSAAPSGETDHRNPTPSPQRRQP